MLKILAAVVLFVAGTQLAEAQFEQPRKSVAAGKTTSIRSFFNCLNAEISAVSGTASHGTIRTREVTQNRCGNRTQRAIVADYTPHPGYRGFDEVYLYWGRGGRGRIYLNVK